MTQELKKYPCQLEYFEVFSCFTCWQILTKQHFPAKMLHWLLSTILTWLWQIAQYKKQFYQQNKLYTLHLLFFLFWIICHCFKGQVFHISVGGGGITLLNLRDQQGCYTSFVVHWIILFITFTVDSIWNSFLCKERLLCAKRLYCNNGNKTEQLNEWGLMFCFH